MIHFKDLDAEVQNYILDSFLVINNKIDLLAFAVRPNKDKTISFFGKEGKKLTTQKRVLVDFYDDAMRYFTNNENKLFNSEFIGKTFFMEYYSEHSPNLRKPRRVPKNNFILSYVKENEQVYPPNSDIASKFASSLDIDPPPIIWEGTLNEDQKTLLLDMAYADILDREIFERLSILFPKSSDYISMYNFEGLVLYYKEDRSWNLVKIVDPEYTRKIKEKIRAEEESGKKDEEIVGSWFDRKTIINIEMIAERNTNPWEFIEEVVEYIIRTKNYEELKGTDTFFDINFKLLPPNILHTIRSDPKKKEAFRHIFHILTAYSIKRIAKKYNLPSDVIMKLEYISDKLNLKNIDVFDAVDSDKTETNIENEDGVSLLVGRFQPPHMGHIMMVNDFAQYAPVFCIVHTGEKRANSPFPKEVISEIFDKLIEDKFLPPNTKYYFSKTGYIPDFIKEHNLNVKEILAGEDRISGYIKQFPEDTDIKFITTIRYFKGEDVRRWIKNQDLSKLEEAVPNEEYAKLYVKLLKPFL